ncbi:TonB-dependent receptor [soil metagenome]
MKKINTCFYLVIIILKTAVFPLFAQSNIISGNITDAGNNEPLAGVNIQLKGRLIGTTSNLNGDFELVTREAPPLTLVFSMVGFETREIEITDEAGARGLNISLEETTLLGQEVVVSASRVEENIMQSPVSVETMDIRAIRDTPSPNFYDALANLKGIELNTQSLTFKSVNARGFNANANFRMVQMLDGMDNQAPGLNFPIGNVVGISELDLESVELLPGAASALYGPNAINGILLMNSKSPFLYQGLSAMVRTGINHVDGRDADPSPVVDVAARYAHVFNDKLAFKANVAYFNAEDWHATNNSNKSHTTGEILPGSRETDPNYNGVNIYGDETSTNMLAVGQAMVNAGIFPEEVLPLIPNTSVSRTGYEEMHLVDYSTESLKLSGAIHYRINDRIEAILQGSYGAGTSVYTGADRFSLSKFNMGQYKAELRGSNFFLRAYTTQERSGDAYASGTLAQLINESWKQSEQWFPEYVAAFVVARATGQSTTQAHDMARVFADQGRYEPGSAEFNAEKDRIAAQPLANPGPGLPRGGARFLDKTNMYHYEGMYNFSNQIDFIELIAGFNYRIYDLNSEGTLFARDEQQNEFSIHEYGGYVQASKRLLNENLKLTASVRYDKNENFQGQFSPRASAVYTLLDNHNIRASYQTGFRIPPNQDQYIDLLVPQARLIGGLPLFIDRYNLRSNPVYTPETVAQFGAAFQAALPAAQQEATGIAMNEYQTGQISQEEIPGRVAELTPAIAVNATSDVLQPYEFREFKPEQVRAYEIGYKSLIANRLLVDVYYYFNRYKNFNGQQIFIQSNLIGNPLGLFNPNTRQVYRIPINFEDDITTQGGALGLDYSLPRGYSVGGNITYNELLNAGSITEGETQYNTPRFRTSVLFGHREIIPNLGFNIAWRWQEDFLWQSGFAVGVVPSFHVFDAQVSYRISNLKSIVKVGGSNIFNNRYFTAMGNPSVGALYFISITFDEMFR